MEGGSKEAGLGESSGLCANSCSRALLDLQTKRLVGPMRGAGKRREGKQLQFL